MGATCCWNARSFMTSGLPYVGALPEAMARGDVGSTRWQPSADVQLYRKQTVSEPRALLPSYIMLLGCSTGSATQLSPRVLFFSGTAASARLHGGCTRTARTSFGIARRYVAC